MSAGVAAMKLVRFACLVCLVLGIKTAAGQDAADLPADSALPSIMEIRPEPSLGEPTPATPSYGELPENPYRGVVEVEEVTEVAQAPKPATTLAPPVVRTAPQAAPALVGNGPSVPPEMWLYSEQIRRHDDPAQAVRRKAELRAEQRMGRIAAMKWFGFSNARPQASPIPMMGGYSPVWIGNGRDRYDWVGAAWPETAVLIDNYNFDVRR
jgi:hypothetical protein